MIVPVKVIALLLLLATMLQAVEPVEIDVCVYGGTPGGMAAAIQTARMQKTVVLLEFDNHIGGLTTGGLGATDIGNRAAIGGIAREFYGRIAEHYAEEGSWIYEQPTEYFARRAGSQTKASDPLTAPAGQRTMWTFEPKVAELIFKKMLQDAGVPVRYHQRLASVRKRGDRIVSIAMEDGSEFRAKMYIDASYEGDLMAKAGVQYHVRREANSVYRETLNGVRAKTPKHQFLVHVDPYVRPGDASSGLLPFVQRASAGKPGTGDDRVQAYNYRLCFTTNDTNRLPVTPPPHYDPAQYELLARYVEALVKAGKKPQLSQFWHPVWLPNHKTDINNNGGFSTDFIGANSAYAEASHKERARIALEHEHYTRGFITFLATSPRVPENIRAEIQRWGPCKDEFDDNGGWPNQLYVREARRMISDYVMTEHNCRAARVVEDPVGLGAYNMDSHNVQRIVKNGRVENEGDVQEPVKPYPISYRSLVPKQRQCANLFVPVCLAASHIAYGSIRMEPVFMILGQSCATAAALAIDDDVPVQKVDYPRLRQRLLADKQVLAWAPWRDN
jgi:hypothetical protein